jgi:gliding motility-associated lipoprotein GldH
MHQISLITHKAKLILCAIVGLALLQSCNRDTFYNKVETLTSDEWLSKDAVVFELDVEDSTKPYDLSLILRHSGEYEYSNIFFLMHIIPPDSNIKNERFGITCSRKIRVSAYRTLYHCY